MLAFVSVFFNTYEEKLLKNNKMSSMCYFFCFVDDAQGFLV